MNVSTTQCELSQLDIYLKLKEENDSYRYFSLYNFGHTL